MIEKTILDHLSERLDVKVYMEEPEKPPKSYVILEKVGSSQLNLINTASFAIQSYGPSMLQAATLNVEVKAAMADLVIHSDVISCKPQTDYNFTDPTTKRYRYQALYDINHY